MLVALNDYLSQIILQVGKHISGKTTTQEENVITRWHLAFGIPCNATLLFQNNLECFVTNFLLHFALQCRKS